jgi:hypothetical protein
MLKITITEIDQDFKFYTTEQLAHIIEQAENIIEQLISETDIEEDDTVLDRLNRVSSLLFEAQFRLHDTLDAADMHNMN